MGFKMILKNQKTISINFIKNREVWVDLYSVAKEYKKHLDKLFNTKKIKSSK